MYLKEGPWPKQTFAGTLVQRLMNFCSFFERCLRSFDSDEMENGAHRLSILKKTSLLECFVDYS